MTTADACTSVLYRYCSLIDSGHASEVPGLFCPDGVWRMGAAAVVGTEELQAAFDERQAATNRTTRHVLTNVVIEASPAVPHEATGSAYLTAYRFDATEPGARVAPLHGPFMVGDLRGRFSQVDGRWLIAELSTHPVLVRQDDRPKKAAS